MLLVETSNSNSDSGPNSPPVVVPNSQVSASAGQNTPIQEVKYSINCFFFSTYSNDLKFFYVYIFFLIGGRATL